MCIRDRYNIQANVSYSKNKIIFQDEVEPNEPYMWRTGNPVGALFGDVYKRQDFSRVIALIAATGQKG